ncbi:MAG: hypothetical protein RDU20_04105 [Desulfomonilaceae bacterium]|nr:hypothetical protein [Desulfomonilaceae bacterium]
MTKSTLCFTVGLICLSLISTVAAQQDSARRKTPRSLPTEVCRAMEQYIATVEAARSVKDGDDRKARYAAAEKKLAEVLKRYGKTALLTEITEYAHYSERAATAGARDPDLTKILADQLKIRTKLLEWCTSDDEGN